METAKMELFWDQLERLGFRDAYASIFFQLFIEKKLQADCYFTKPLFHDEPVRYRLDFKADDQSGIPRLAGFRARLNIPGQKNLYHYFKVNGRFNDTTAQEACHLLCGRSVVKFKEGQPNVYEGVWIRLMPLEQPGEDTCFKETELPPFDIHGELNRLQLREMRSDREAALLIHALIRGEPGLAHVLCEGKEIPIYLAANPVTGSFDLYDNNYNETTLDKLPGDQKKSEQSHLVKPAVDKKKSVETHESTCE